MAHEATKEIGILAVASALPRARASAQQLAEQYGIDPAAIDSQLGLVEKCVALDDDEHPSDFAANAALRALEAAGASRDDVGLVIFCGVSRDYMGSWNAAIDVLGRLKLERAMGYDLNLGCVAPLVAMDIARKRGDDGYPPLTVIVSAERWSHTLSPSVPFSLAWIAHADGGAACVFGPRPSHRLVSTSFRVTPAFNNFMAIPAGGTREPVSAEAVARNRHFRTILSRGAGDIKAHYIDSYAKVIDQALSQSGNRLEDVDLFVMNQVRPAIRNGIREALGIPEERVVNTYPRVGHIGGADIFLGLEAACREGRQRSGLVLLAASSVSTFAAVTLKQTGEGKLAIPR